MVTLSALVPKVCNIIMVHSDIVSSDTDRIIFIIYTDIASNRDSTMTPVVSVVDSLKIWTRHAGLDIEGFPTAQGN